jgi:hypothetical protein
MTEVYVNKDQICYVEETDLSVQIYMTSGEVLSIAESISEVMKVIDRDDLGNFYCFTRFHPTDPFGINIDNGLDNGGDDGGIEGALE